MVLKARAWLVVAAVAAAVVVFWSMRRSATDADGSGAGAENPADTGGGSALAAAPAPVSPPAPLPSLAPAAVKGRDAAADSRAAGTQIVGPHADDPHQPGMLPHPTTDAHRRLYAENDLVQRLNDAMAAHDVPAMRTLVGEYRRLDPTDQDASQAGYTLIADCLERPGPASLVAAQHFYDTARHSPLRRYLRRICFENAD